jgi:hypothetical protein
MVEIEFRPGDDFRRAQERIRRAPKEIRLALNREIRDATKPAQGKLKEAVLGLDSASSRGGGTAQRQAHADSRSRRGSASTRNRGLRAGIARGITTKITYGGVRSGVRIRVDARGLPENQKVLVRDTNRGKVRHPVFGSDNWVTQTFTPKGWFNTTMRREGAVIVRKIDAAARRALSRLQ